MSYGISQIENRAMIWKKHQVFAGGASGGSDIGNGKVVFVDGDRTSSGAGDSWDSAFATIQEGVTAAGAGGTVYVVAKTITDYTGDPTSYAETVIIPYTHSSMQLIGVSRGRTQGGLPQIKKGSGSTALLTIRAPGCLIQNMGFNGAGSTGGGILLDDDYATKAAFGTSVYNCHFKNCKVTTTVAASGGAIYTSSAGNAWQCHFAGNRFYKNEVDICLAGTSSTVPQDWIIEDNVFSGPADSVNCNLFLTGGGSGINGVVIKNNTFQQLPALTSGDVARYIHATGCVGMLVGNTFGCQTGDTGGTKITFKAAGTGAYIPVTMHVAGNYGQSITASETGEINIA